MEVTIFLFCRLTALLPRTDDNCSVFAHKITQKSSEFDMHHMAEFFMLFLDVILYDNPSNGLVIIVDMKEVPSHGIFQQFHKVSK